MHDILNRLDSLISFVGYSNCLTSTSKKIDPSYSSTSLILLLLAVQLHVRVPAPLLTHAELTFANNFALITRFTSSSTAIILVNDEPDAECCGAAMSCGVKRCVAGDKLPEGGDPKEDLLIFTILRCLITSSLARAAPFCGNSFVALKIVRCFKTSSLARHGAADVVSSLVDTEDVEFAVAKDCGTSLLD